MRKRVRWSLYCSCGNEIVVRGMCGICYAMKKQDGQHFGGLREVVLDRDGRRCRVCDAPGGRKRSLAVHHRVPGRSELDLMITLCLACHAKVTRTLAMDKCWPLLLVELWREQHPDAHEQMQLEFKVRSSRPVSVRLFPQT